MTHTMSSNNDSKHKPDPAPEADVSAPTYMDVLVEHLEGNTNLLADNPPVILPGNDGATFMTRVLGWLSGSDFESERNPYIDDSVPFPVLPQCPLGNSLGLRTPTEHRAAGYARQHSPTVTELLDGDDSPRPPPESPLECGTAVSIGDQPDNYNSSRMYLHGCHLIWQGEELKRQSEVLRKQEDAEWLARVFGPGGSAAAVPVEEDRRSESPQPGPSGVARPKRAAADSTNPDDSSQEQPPAKAAKLAPADEVSTVSSDSLSECSTASWDSNDLTRFLRDRKHSLD